MSAQTQLEERGVGTANLQQRMEAMQCGMSGEVHSLQQELCEAWRKHKVPLPAQQLTSMHASSCSDSRISDLDCLACAEELQQELTHHKVSAHQCLWMAGSSRHLCWPSKDLRMCGKYTETSRGSRRYSTSHVHVCLKLTTTGAALQSRHTAVHVATRRCFDQAPPCSAKLRTGFWSVRWWTGFLSSKLRTDASSISC